MFLGRFFLRACGVVLPKLRAEFFRILKHLYFRSVGRDSSFYGWPSFGTFNDNISVGAGCLIGRGVFFSAGRDSQIDIQDGCSVNTGCHIVALYGITIGAGTRIGEFCSIRDQNHGFEDSSASVTEQGYSGGPITIGRNCWIGRGVFVGPGVTIGDHSIIGANAVVVKSVPERCVAVGAPARPIRYLEVTSDA